MDGLEGTFFGYEPQRNTGYTGYWQLNILSQPTDKILTFYRIGMVGRTGSYL